MVSSLDTETLTFIIGFTQYLIYIHCWQRCTSLIKHNNLIWNEAINFGFKVHVNHVIQFNKYCEALRHTAFLYSLKTPKVV